MQTLRTKPALAFFATLLCLPIVSQAGEILRCGEAAPGRYIVVLADGFPGQFTATDEVMPQQVFQRAQSLRFQYGGNIRHVYHSALRGYAAADLPEKQARMLASDPRVSHVEEDCSLQPSAVQSNPPWELDRIDERYLPMDGEYVYNRTGHGVHAYVLDFLVRRTHSEFGNRVLSRVDCTGADPSSGTCPAVPLSEVPVLSHGTAVASKIGGSSLGVAKQVRLHSVKVCADPDGDPSSNDSDCYASDVIAGVNYVKANRINPAVANVSLNYPPSHPDYFSAAFVVRSAIESAIADGVPFVISAGNDNTNACNRPPANVPNAIVVAGTIGSDMRWPSSNYGSCVDLFAPAYRATVALADSDSATSLANGTSFSAPLTAGLAALYLQGASGASPAQVTNFILSWATNGLVTDTQGSPNLLLYSRYGGLKEN